MDQIFRIFDKDGNGSIDFKVTFLNLESQLNDGKTNSLVQSKAVHFLAGLQNMTGNNTQDLCYR